MPRTNRLIVVDSAVHITCRGNNKQTLFHCEQDKYCYYGFLRDFKDENGVKIYHYCLMDNHVHFLTWIENGTRLARFMKQVNLAYFSYYAKNYGYCGHLFQGRFASSIINNEQYLLRAGKYIELNPVRAGIVAFPEDYRYSSYSHYAHGRFDVLVTDDPLYTQLSSCLEERRRLYIERLIDEQEFKQKKKIGGRPRKK